MLEGWFQTTEEWHAEAVADLSPTVRWSSGVVGLLAAGTSLIFLGKTFHNLGFDVSPGRSVLLVLWGLVTGVVAWLSVHNLKD